MSQNDRAKYIRNELHNLAEPSMQEKNTSKYIADALKKNDIETKENVFGYGLIGTVKGNIPGPIIGIRADMDALTHTVNGVEKIMHTCGHDAHSAIVLATIEEIKQDGLKKGTVKAIFQPAEETLKGAIGMAESGELDDLDYIIGLHLRPIQEAKGGEATPALKHGASSLIEVSIHGINSHGARPHLGINTIDAGVMVVNAVNAIHMDPSQPWSVKVTKFNSNGKIINAVPDGTELALDLRAQSNDLMEKMKKKTIEVIKAAATVNGATVEVRDLGGVPGAEYDDEVTEILRESIIEVLGEKGLLPEIVSPGGEDFHFFKLKNPKVKAGYMGLGVDLTPGLHNPDMTFDDNFLRYGVQVLKKAIYKILENN